MEFKTCSCHIEGVEIQFINKLFHKNFKGLSLGPSITLPAYEGSIIPVLGQVTLSVRSASRQSFPFSFYVTTKGANLMGVDLFDRLRFQIVSTMTNDKNLVIVDDKVRQEWSNNFQGLSKVEKFSPRPMLRQGVTPVRQTMRLRYLCLCEKKYLRRSVECCQKGLLSRLIPPLGCRMW